MLAYIQEHLTKFMLTVSELENFLQRYAICSRGSLKMNCERQNSLVCISLLVSGFITKRFIMKSRVQK